MQISAIIPVVNEPTKIQYAIEKAWLAGADEVIVVDGNSSDDTFRLAQESNCSVFQSTPGRATQLNHGVKQANGVVVLFLHVDTWLEAGACDQIRACLLDDHVQAGAFEQRIDSNRRLIKWIEKGNARRVRWFNLAYGDQGIFLRKQVFESIGGFPEVKLMEDYILSQKLRKISSFALLPGPLHVDARRWERHGPFRQTLRNWCITAAYRLGISPDRLAGFYQRHD